MKRYLICPDLHLPYEHKPSVEMMFAIMKDNKFDEFIQLGDLVDFYATSSHVKAPDLAHITLKEEADYANDWLDAFTEKFPKLKKTITLGNHSNRLERYIANKAPELFGVTDTQKILKFNKRDDWTAIPYSNAQLYRIGRTNLYARHCPYSNSSAKASLKNGMINLVYGHTHRREVFETRGMNGETYVNMSPGFMGDRKHKKIFGYAVDRKAVGLVVVYEHDDGTFDYKLINIDDKRSRCVFNGVIYTFNKKTSRVNRARV